MIDNEPTFGEKKLRSVLHSFPDIINLIHVDGTYLEALPNSAECDFITDRNIIAGKNIIELLPEQVALGQLQGIQQALSTGEVQVLEQTLEINNRLKHQEVRIIPMQKDVAVVVVRDVSDRKVAEESLKKQYQRSQLLAEVTLKIRQSLKIDEILQTTVTELQKIFAVDRTLLFQFQPDGTGIIAKESVSEQFAALIDQHLDDPCFRMHQAEQYAKGKFSKIENIDVDNLSPCYADFLRQFDVKASIIIPIIHIDNLWGLLIVHQCDRPRQWKDPEIELMQQLADQLAIAITQSQLVESLRKSLQREQMLNQLLQTIRSSLDLNIVFNSATQAIATLLDLEQVGIVQYLEERKTWKYIAVFRDNPELADHLGLEIPDENNPLAEKLKNFEIVQVNDTNAIEDELNKEFAKKKSGAWLIIPIIVNGKTWASLSLRKIHKVVDWEPQIIELAQTIANQLAIAIQQVTLHEQLQIELAKHKETEVKLQQSKELAEAANKAKSEFLANMSHEIRTPMNGVLGMAQLLATTSLSDEQKGFVQTILDSGDALLTIINDILDFSKIESGNLELEQREFNIIDTVNSVCNLLSKEAFDKNIKLQCQINHDLPKIVIGDSSRFRQILINLMGNAIKFTKVGSIEMIISGKWIMANPAQPTYEFKFAIADTGIGIDNEQIHKLFHPFTQADASINRKFGGTGLGLAICKRLVELMQGKIWMESHGVVGGNPPSDWISEGSKNNTQDSAQGSSQGSTFHFAIALPLGKQEQIKHQIDTFSQLAANQETTPLKILLVEDNAFNQKVALLMLKKLGYQADVADNGREAVDHLFANLNSEKAYDFVFMDVQMPIMDGRTATKIIRENVSSTTKPWIVALTADALPEDRDACLDSGMNDYITKPVNIQEIMRSISDFQLAR